MKQKEILSKLEEILSFSEELIASDFQKEIIYDMIFSPKISKQVFSLFQQTPIRFDYYDPDSSYEEDYMAFINAFREYVKILKVSIQTNSSNNESLYDRFHAL